MNYKSLFIAENSLIEEHDVDGIETNSQNEQLANDTKEDKTVSLNSAAGVPSLPDIASLLNTTAAMSPKHRG